MQSVLMQYSICRPGSRARYPEVLKAFILLAMIGLFTSTRIHAAELSCGDTATWEPGTIVLTGKKIIDPTKFGLDPRFSPPPTTYKERLELKKADHPESMEGRWKVVRMVQEQSGVNGMDGMSGHTKVPIMPGHFLECTYHVAGGYLVNDCTKGNLYLDFHKGRIGSLKTNTWIGKYDKNGIQVRFGQPPYTTSPLLTSKSFVPDYDIQLDVEMIRASDRRSGKRHVFSKDESSRFEITYQAKVSPASYADKVKWDIPNIGSSIRLVSHPNGRADTLTISWTELPDHNSAFGKKTVTASLTVDACGTARESQTFEIFFPATVHNNPGPSSPNWFYYWNQTPAKDVSDIPVSYGDDSIGQCRSPAASAFYSPAQEAMYVCNLASDARNNFHVYVQGVLREPPYVNIRDKAYINAFASSLVHENIHYRAHQARKKKQKDSDGDGLTDALEIKLGFNPHKKLTFYDDMDAWLRATATNKKKTRHYLKRIKTALTDSDEEWLAYEVQGKFSRDFSQYDWAFPGAQWH